MSRKTIILVAVVCALSAGAALWLLMLPSGGPRVQRQLLSAVNPGLEVRYHYDGKEFTPAPFVPDAEFPLRLDAAGWSFYAKRIAGAGTFLKHEAQPVVYKFVTDAFSSIYTEFYRLHIEGDIRTTEVELGQQHAIRQEIKLVRQTDSRGWPAYFPLSVTGGVSANLAPPDTEADRVLGGIAEVDRQSQGQSAPTATGKPADTAYVYAWALFTGPDLFLFQAVSAQPLPAARIAQCEGLINSMEFNALRGTAPGQAGVAQPPSSTK